MMGVGFVTSTLTLALSLRERGFSSPPFAAWIPAFAGMTELWLRFHPHPSPLPEGEGIFPAALRRLDSCLRRND